MRFGRKADRPWQTRARSRTVKAYVRLGATPGALWLHFVCLSLVSGYPDIIEKLWICPAKAMIWPAIAPILQDFENTRKTLLLFLLLLLLLLLFRHRLCACHMCVLLPWRVRTCADVSLPRPSMTTTRERETLNPNTSPPWFKQTRRFSSLHLPSSKVSRSSNSPSLSPSLDPWLKYIMRPPSSCLYL